MMMWGAAVAVLSVAGGALPCDDDFSVSLRKAAYCAKLLEAQYKPDMLCDGACGTPSADGAASKWGFQKLTDLVKSLLTEPFPECSANAPRRGSNPVSEPDSGQVGDSPAQGVLHPLEAKYGLKHPVALHGSSWEPKRRCWDLLDPSSLTGCAHSVERCVNYTELRSSDRCAAADLPEGVRLVAERPLNCECPSYTQLKDALSAALRDMPAVPSHIVQDVLGGYVAIVGDSISKGSLQVAPQVEGGRRLWHRIAYGALAAMSEGTVFDVSKAPPLEGKICSAARDGMSLTKMKLDLEGQGISRFYKVRESPKKLVSRCLKDKRPGRRPTFVIVMLGTNDFLDDGSVKQFEAEMKWLLQSMWSWTGGSIRGLLLATNPLPAVGRREEKAGGGYRWRAHARAAVLRVAEWARELGTYKYVLTTDTATSLQWCEEHNFADGIHPNPRGHLLMGIEMLRAMLASQP